LQRSQKNHDDVYLFIGGGPDTSPVFKNLETQKSSLKELDGRAFLLGFVPVEVLKPIFSVADLFVSASEMEGFGMSVSQAAGAGTAVISSDLIPFSTQYSKGSALVVPAGKEDAFVEAIDHLLSDDKERADRAQQLLEVAADFDWVITAQRFVDWFHEKKEIAQKSSMKYSVIPPKNTARLTKGHRTEDLQINKSEDAQDNSVN